VRTRKAWNGGQRPAPRNLGAWAMTQLAEVAIGERLIVQIADGRPMALRVLEPVAFEDSRELYDLLAANSGIANGIVIGIGPGKITLNLT
jgi:hypothetical protein